MSQWGSEATVSRQGYFMSETDEKAAKWDMLQDLKAQRLRLGVLHEKADKIGKSLRDFGTVLQNPSWEFTRKEASIKGKATIAEARGAEFEITLTDLNADEICKLIDDIEGTKQRIKTLQERLGEY